MQAPSIRFPPGSSVRIEDLDPDETGGLEKGKEVNKRLEKARDALAVLQERLYAESRQSLLVVLQAKDTAGKDGAIKHVMGPLNPQSCYVTSFKKPSTRELSHDFLWRVHLATPQKGQIGIFNRSHYEDVLVVKVHKIVDDATVTRRYAHINNFEALLNDAGTRVVKFFLLISKEEQRRRLLARVADPNKHWKLSPSDLPERARWDDYVEAFDAAITATNTAANPWHVVPSNRKWYRNLVIAETLVSVLEDMNPQYPPPSIDITSMEHID